MSEWKGSSWNNTVRVGSKTSQWSASPWNANTGYTAHSQWSASASSWNGNTGYNPAVAHSLDQHDGASGHLDPSVDSRTMLEPLRLSRPQDKPQEALWYHINLPPVGYLVVRFDLDTIRFEEHAMMSQTLTDFKYLVHVFCTAGHQSGVRSPLYHLTASLRRAQQRVAKGA